MSVELASVRALAPFFGSSVFVWTNLIGVVLACLSLGYFVGGRLADRWSNSKPLVLLLLVGAGLTALAPFIAYELSPLFLPDELRLEDAFPMLWGGSLSVGLIAFGIPAFFLSLTGPVSVRLLSREGRIGTSAGTVFALSTLGSILGTFATTYLLVPVWGTRMTFFVAATVVALPSLALWFVEKGFSSGSLLATALFFTPLASHAVLAGGAIKGPRNGENLIAEGETAYQYVQIVRDGDRTILRVNEGLDSYQSLWVEGSLWTQAYYDHFLLAPLLAEKKAGEKLRVLILGLGAGTVSRQYHDWFAERYRLQVDGVELDPGVVELSGKPFRLDSETQPNLRVWKNWDARAALQRAQTAYDIVILDAYAAQIHVPFHLATREFFGEVWKHMDEGGVFAINVGLLDKNDPTIRGIASTVAAVFGEVQGAPVRNSRNEILWARKAKPLPNFAALHDRDPVPELRNLLGYAAIPGMLRVYREPSDATAWTDDRCPVDLFQTRALLRSGSR